MADITFKGGVRDVPDAEQAHFQAMVDGLFEAAARIVGDMAAGDQVVTAYGYLVKIFSSSAQARLARIQPNHPLDAITAVAATTSYMAGQSLELIPPTKREDAQCKLTMAMLKGADDHPFDKAWAEFNQRRSS